MFAGFCHFGNWGSLGNFGVLGWAGLILNLLFWAGLIGGLILLVVLTARRTRAQAANVVRAAEQPTAREILQAQYARGAINREQYEQMKKDIG